MTASTPEQPIVDPLAPAAPVAPGPMIPPPSLTPTAPAPAPAPTPAPVSAGVAVGDVVRVTRFDDTGRDVGHYGVVVELLTQPDETGANVALARVCQLPDPHVSLASACVAIH